MEIFDSKSSCLVSNAIELNSSVIFFTDFGLYGVIGILKADEAKIIQLLVPDCHDCVEAKMIAGCMLLLHPLKKEEETGGCGGGGYEDRKHGKVTFSDAGATTEILYSVLLPLMLGLAEIGLGGKELTNIKDLTNSQSCADATAYMWRNWRGHRLVALILPAPEVRKKDKECRQQNASGHFFKHGKKPFCKSKSLFVKNLSARKDSSSAPFSIPSPSCTPFLGTARQMTQNY
ncbi:unnamed protein product [Ilex paraguariensis]|uniref:Uncharacterized protein n=1 Tax=Ilex paraguariensis TaxID=185542 RepID=A0ABC8UN32_9AQUA